MDKNSGVVTGCELSHTADTISIDDGYFCVRGRFLQEEGGSTINIEATTQNDIYCKVVCEIDLSQENTTSELKQVSYKVLSSSNSYPVLQQEDITAVGQGEIYQFELARFKVTEYGIEDFEDKRTYLDFNSIYSEIRRNIDAFLQRTNITTKEQIDALISDLKIYCDTAKEVLDGDVVMNLINLISNKADPIISKTITLQASNWVLNKETEKYEYTIEDSGITENHQVKGYGDFETKLVDGYTETYNGSFKIITTQLPEEEVSLDITIEKTVRKGGTQ